MSVSRQTLHTNTPVKTDFELPPREFPGQARVVIVGGGIAGAAMAYQFARAGWDGVVLLEQNRIASGTTWHAAGMVGQLRSSSAQTKVNRASVDIYAGLQADTGHDPGWLQCGGLQLAACSARMDQLQRTAAMAELFGVAAHVITPEQCGDYWPRLNVADLVGGVFLPGDGRVLPGECTVALAKGALQRGVQIHDQTAVTDLLVRPEPHGMQRITGVQTKRGTITADWVVLAGNMWLRQLGLKIGVEIPVYPCEHHYLITRPLPGVTRDCPCTRDPDATTYFRSLDDGGMKLGAFKQRTKAWQIGDHVPDDFAFSLLAPDWPDFAEPFAALQHRLPGLSRDDVVQFVNGPEAFTPDNNFLMGEPFLTRGLFVLGGWNSAGIACSAGAAKYAVEWIENGGMTLDLGSVDVRRFLPFQNRRPYLQERVSEVLGLHYQLAWPGRQMETARGMRYSPLHEQHRQHNACFGEEAGWEQPLSYAPPGVRAEIEYSFRRQNWQAWTAAEVRVCRQDAALLDQSSSAKFRLQGADALAVLQRLCGNQIDVPIGNAVDTGMFNERGTFAAEVTVIRESEQSFYIITAAGRQRQDFDWIARHLPGTAAAVLTDITEQIALISVIGPNSQRWLAPLCAELGLSAEPFPFAASRRVEIAGTTVRVVRGSAVGEPSWDLHVAAGEAAAIWQALQPLTPIGIRAIATMRIEMGLPAMGHELSSAVTPLHAGVDAFVDGRKDFLGKAVLAAARQRPLETRLVRFLVDDPDVVLWGGEPILWNGTEVGATTSACHSPMLERSVAMGYLRAPAPLSPAGWQRGEFAIVNLGQPHAARPSLEPWYDPARAFLKMM